MLGARSSGQANDGARGRAPARPRQRPRPGRRGRAQGLLARPATEAALGRCCRRGGRAGRRAGWRSVAASRGLAGERRRVCPRGGRGRGGHIGGPWDRPNGGRARHRHAARVPGQPRQRALHRRVRRPPRRRVRALRGRRDARRAPTSVGGVRIACGRTAKGLPGCRRRLRRQGGGGGRGTAFGRAPASARGVHGAGRAGRRQHHGDRQRRRLPCGAQPRWRGGRAHKRPRPRRARRARAHRGGGRRAAVPRGQVARWRAAAGGQPRARRPRRQGRRCQCRAGVAHLRVERRGRLRHRGM
mmetsp:Transcript_12878/g.54097  ORF Transcript_12878/g.54097 Transcript_12878/m.54097 type:complete len:300 (-) Transcript_12878:507-1406(-)